MPLPSPSTGDSVKNCGISKSFFFINYFILFYFFIILVEEENALTLVDFILLVYYAKMKMVFQGETSIDEGKIINE